MEASFDGAKLREVRKDRGKTQAMLAVKMGTSIPHVRALETGEKTNPSACLLCKVAVALDVPMETFMRIQPEEGDELV